MNNMKQLFVALAQEESGQDMIEYALIAALISLACVTALSSVGTSISTMWSKLASAVTGAAA